MSTAGNCEKWSVISDREAAQPLLARPPETLMSDACTAVHLGAAPDGQPLVLGVARQDSEDFDLVTALHAIRGSLPDAVIAAMRPAELRVRMRALEGALVYCSSKPVLEIIGTTLMARTIGVEGPLSARGPSGGTSPAGAPGPHCERHTTAISHLAPPPHGEGAAATRPLPGGARRLAVGLHGEAACRIVEDRGSELATVRAFVFESLLGRPSAQYHVMRGRVPHSGPLANRGDYVMALRGAAAVGWSIARDDVAHMVAEVAGVLAGLHRKGLVHADVKPSNVLVTGDGALPIDALEVRAGEPSPALTAEWAAPEQVVAAPTSPATDVYALGLLVTAILHGTVYGEERTHVVPSGLARLRLRVLHESGVYVDAASQELSEAAARRWSGFLSRCVAYEPEKRPADASAFDAELREILAAHPIPGRLDVDPGPGVLRANVEVGGRPCHAWVVAD